MPTITFTRRFRHADGGVRVVTYEAGETARVSARCAEVALAGGYAKAAEEKATAAPENKALAAPENKDVTLALRHRGGGYYDIVRSDTGVRINHKGLRKRDALALMEG